MGFFSKLKNFLNKGFEQKTPENVSEDVLVGIEFDPEKRRKDDFGLILDSAIHKHNVLEKRISQHNNPYSSNYKDVESFEKKHNQHKNKIFPLFVRNSFLKDDSSDLDKSLKKVKTLHNDIHNTLDEFDAEVGSQKSDRFKNKRKFDFDTDNYMEQELDAKRSKNNQSEVEEELNDPSIEALCIPHSVASSKF